MLTRPEIRKPEATHTRQVDTGTSMSILPDTRGLPVQIIEYDTSGDSERTEQMPCIQTQSAKGRPTRVSGRGNEQACVLYGHQVQQQEECK